MKKAVSDNTDIREIFEQEFLQKLRILSEKVVSVFNPDDWKNQQKQLVTEHKASFCRTAP